MTGFGSRKFGSRRSSAPGAAAVALASMMGIAAAAASFAWACGSNWSIQRTDATVASPRLPKAFDRLRIVHVSDLHNAEFGSGNVRLLNAIRRAAPDVIFITGDLVDSRQTRAGVAVRFVAAAARIAPVYYVPGNHESRLDEYPQIEASLKRAGATVLANRCVYLARDGERVRIVGVMDPAFTAPHARGPAASVMERNLSCALQGAGDGARSFTLLLTHRPELLPVYAGYHIDVAFAGHAHGGQVRLPGVGGLFAPSQGVLPKVTEGVHVLDQTQLVVSRGLGPSVVPMRVNDRPELVVVDLRRASEGPRP